MLIKIDLNDGEMHNKERGVRPWGPNTPRQCIMVR